MDESTSPRPVPRPRRTIPNLTITQYENVAIDSINKNIQIKDRNIQSESISKIPNNKKFSIQSENEETKSILTETNDLTSSDQNENVENNRPTPAPRRPQNNNSPDQLYENAQELSPKSSTGAISKTHNIAVRKAPEVPKPLNTEASEKSTRHSLTADYTNEFNESAAKLKKSVSNSTLDSSISSASSTNDSSKYRNPSPSDLLKSIGSTSKLLSEAISERVTHKAKGAKHLLDKNLKSSHEKLSNWSCETTNRLKNVRKRINNLSANNFSLSRSEKRDPEFNADRPQTMPPNDQVFQSISFNSPLNKTTNISNLATAESSYEIPRSIKNSSSYPLDSISNYPPSYEDSIRGVRYSYTDADSPASSKVFERNSNVTQSLITHRSVEEPKPPISSSNINKSVPNLHKLAIKEERESSADLHSSNECLPMPNYPAPVLKTDAVYGKINQIEPPARIKRKKNYESIEIRKPNFEPSSNRATIDSIEIRDALDGHESSRDVSIEMKELIQINEKLIPKPERSASWSYHDTNDDECSSPEPIYANQEPTYGKLCEMESDEVNVPLVPKVEIHPIEIANLIISPLPPEPTSPSPKEILYEFDPLVKNRGNTIGKGVDKSNQLLLLENLLGLDTYGSITRDTSTVDDQSVDSSDEDNGNAAVIAVPPPPERTDSLDESAVRQPKPKKDSMQIIHQNPHLRSDSLENIVEETVIESYLARTDDNPINEEVDLTRPSQSQSLWFVDDANNRRRPNPFNKNTSKSPVDKTANKLPPGIPPPSYSEAMASSKSTEKLSDNKYPALPPDSAQSNRTVKSMFSNVFNKMESLKRKTSFRGARPSDVRVLLEMVPKPTLSQRMVLHEGHLIRLPSGGVEDILKEMQNRVAYLRDRKFITFVDKDMKNQKETFSLEHITTIQCVSNHKFSNNAMQMYCFEVTTAVPKNQGSQQALANPNMIVTNTNSGNTKLVRACHLYGVVKESERDIWMHKLVDSLTSVFPRNLTCQYYRAGWCYLKSSISAQWSGTWLILQKRKRRLVYYCESDMNTEKLDLRKARCIVLKDSDDSIKNLHVEAGPLLMIDCPPYTIYLVMSSSRETKIWRHIIREVAHNNGPALNEQQLTKHNVPVLVDKCINFIYIHGSMSEGIYRKSGSVAAIQKLMGLFRTDAFSVEMTRSEYSEHDVANVLKRFMRNLPQTLLGKCSASFVSITKVGSKVERIAAYKELLTRLPDIEFQTLKKLVGHLAFIQSQKSKNKMGVDNLAVIWGPTLLQNNSEEMAYSQNEADVISDLVTLYKNLYQLTPDEVVKEQEMLCCLQKYYAAAENLADTIKQSGDLKVWITLNPDDSKEEKTQINVTLTPTKTAYEVCKELSTKMKLPAHQLTLNEVILNDNLERPLHHSERLFEIVLRWSYWPEADRKNNYLVVKPIKILHDVNRALKHLATISPSNELKFADNKTKSLKSYQVEMRDGKIFVLKKEKGPPSILKEIALYDVTAYLGCEKKREFQSRWAITLVEINNKKVLRSRDLPYIGHIIAGADWQDQLIWLSGIWHSLYRDDIMPPGEIIIP